MALETNARIPSPYVYKPVDFGGKIDAEATKKEAALKAGIQTKKDLKTKNAAALKLEPDLTGKAVLNKAIINQYNNILEEYSKVAAAGDNIYDPSTFYGEAFAKDVTALDDFANQMKDVEKDITEIEDKKASDPGVYDYFTSQLREAKLPQDVSNTIVEYRQNKNTLDKAPAIVNAVAGVVNDAAKDKDIVDITKLKEFDQLNIKNSISDDKIKNIFNQTKVTEPSQLQEQIFTFKKNKGISDPEFDEFDSYDEYLKDKIKNQIALTSSNNEQLKSKWQFIVNNNQGGSNTTNTGNTGISGPGNVGYQFNKIGPPENVGGVIMMPIDVSDEAINKTGAAVENRSGQNYVKLEDLWRFEDKDNPHSKILLDWVWSDKQAKDKTWKPDQGRYYTIDNKEVVGKPSNIIWDQDGNGWANIDSGSGKNAKVLIYPKTPDAYTSQSDVTNNSKSNAKQLLITFDEATPKGTLDSKAMSDPWTTVNNIFNRQTGLVTDIE
jgi:hypothetical protein